MGVPCSLQQHSLRCAETGLKELLLNTAQLSNHRTIPLSKQEILNCELVDKHGLRLSSDVTEGEDLLWKRLTRTTEQACAHQSRPAPLFETSHTRSAKMGARRRLGVVVQRAETLESTQNEPWKKLNMKMKQRVSEKLHIISIHMYMYNINEYVLQYCRNRASTLFKN